MRDVKEACVISSIGLSCVGNGGDWGVRKRSQLVQYRTYQRNVRVPVLARSSVLRS
jgi:hypothetical protein